MPFNKKPVVDWYILSADPEVGYAMGHGAGLGFGV